MNHVDPFDELFDSPSAQLALHLAREDRKLLADLVAMRRSLGLTQSELAERIGVSQATISDFESAGNDPKMSTVRRYARALGAMIRHQLDPEGMADGSEDLTHFAGSGIATTQTADAVARELRGRSARVEDWNSSAARQAVRQRAARITVTA